MDWKEEVALVGAGESALPQVEPGDVPDIALYMDQLVTFLDQRLGSGKRDPSAPFVTSTMVNNYTKARLIPPAVHKRYQQRHVLGLCLVGQLKKVLSMQDLGRITASVGNDNQESSLYQIFLEAQRQATQDGEALIRRAMNHSEAHGLEGNAALAAMAVELAASAQYRAMLAERLLDRMTPAEAAENPKKAGKKTDR